ncbi:polygalacturonase QRT3-like [Aristolochia californica]|uniref:polygalacturonase QRT3-like n=1 Tax=Aristolochia californica TaxID=171875 RepID=UPI0035E3B02F
MKVVSCFLLAIVLATSHFAVSTPLPRRSVKEHRRLFEERSAGRDISWIKKNGRIFYPVGYGADPSGKLDSSDAIIGAVNDAYKARSEITMLPGISDLGGVVIELQGGQYKLSKPIRFPPNAGNIVVRGGTLRASEDFPTDRFLIELWAPSSKPVETVDHVHATDAGKTIPDPLLYHYEDITFQDILFDAGYRGGGLFVIDAVRIRIDNCFVIHFGTTGILVEKGHETFISNSFLGQHITAGGDPHERNFSGVAIDLASNDNVITDVAIFSAATGVILSGQANMLTGVHCYNKATFFGGVGVLIKLAGLGQTRISNSYMDWTGIVMEDPVQVHVADAFFLGNAYILLKSIKGQISGLNIVDNMFTGDGSGVPIIQLDESNGPFTNIDQVVIDRNNVGGMQLKSTVVRKSVAANGSKWVANFSSELVFPNRINHVQYSLYERGQQRLLPEYAVTKVSNNTVTVESRKEVDGVVSVVVDQNLMLGETMLM